VTGEWCPFQKEGVCIETQPTGPALWRCALECEAGGPRGF